MYLKLIKIHKTSRNLNKKTNQKSKNNKRDNTNKKQTYRNHIVKIFKWKKEKWTEIQKEGNENKKTSKYKDQEIYKQKKHNNNKPMMKNK